MNKLMDKLINVLTLIIAALGFIQEAFKNMESGNGLLASVYIIGFIAIGGVLLYAKLKNHNLAEQWIPLNKVMAYILLALILPSNTVFWCILALWECIGIVLSNKTK